MKSLFFLNKTKPRLQGFSNDIILGNLGRLRQRNLKLFFKLFQYNLDNEKIYTLYKNNKLMINSYHVLNNKLIYQYKIYKKKAKNNFILKLNLKKPTPYQNYFVKYYRDSILLFNFDKKRFYLNYSKFFSLTVKELMIKENNYFLNNFNNLVLENYYMDFSKKFVGYISNVLHKSYISNSFFFTRIRNENLTYYNYLKNGINVKNYFFKSVDLFKLYIIGGDTNISDVKIGQQFKKELEYLKYITILDAILIKKNFYKNFLNDFFLRKNYGMYKYALSKFFLNDKNIAFFIEKDIFLFLNNFTSNFSRNIFSSVELTGKNKYTLPVNFVSYKKMEDSFFYNFLIYKNIFLYSLHFMELNKKKKQNFLFFKLFKIYTIFFFFQIFQMMSKGKNINIIMNFNNYIYNRIYKFFLMKILKLKYIKNNRNNFLIYYYILLFLKRSYKLLIVGV
jgi:hypothetical protein